MGCHFLLQLGLYWADKGTQEILEVVFNLKIIQLSEDFLYLRNSLSGLQVEILRNLLKICVFDSPPEIVWGAAWTLEILKLSPAILKAENF